MRWCRFFIALSCGIVGIAAIAFVAARGLDGPMSVSARLVSSVPQGGAKEVTAELQSFHHFGVCAESLQIQCRIAGRWSLPQKMEDYQQTYLPSNRTNTENLVFTVPAKADACRLSLDYRVIRVNGCRAHAFMNRYGLSSFPRLRVAIVSFVSKPSALHESQCELALPQDAPAKLAAAN